MKNKDNYNLKILKVLNIFIENPYEKFYLREIAKQIKISPNTANRFLNKLLKENLITEKRQANLRYFRANLNSKTFKQIKITFSINNIEKSNLLKYLQEKNFDSVILFGSIAKGEDDKLSDIDLLIIGNTKTNLFQFEKKLNKEIQSHFFTQEQWEIQKKKNKAFYQEIISTGITLLGNKPL